MQQKCLFAGAAHFVKSLAQSPRDTFTKVAHGMRAPRDIMPLSYKLIAGFGTAVGAMGTVVGVAVGEPVTAVVGGVLASSSLDMYLEAGNEMDKVTPPAAAPEPTP